MALITKSIGATGRDYSTIDAWEDDLENAGVYSAGDSALGECYDDAAFDEAVTLDGGATIGLTEVTLTVASGERHDGTAGTGARIIRSAGGTILTLSTTVVTSSIRWLEISSNGNTSTVTQMTHTNTNGTTKISDKILAHDWTSTSGSNSMFSLAISGTTTHYAIRCILYDGQDTSVAGATVAGIGCGSGANPFVFVLNSTVANIQNNGGTGAASVCSFPDAGRNTYRNVIAADPGGSSSGGKVCFSDSSYTSSPVGSLASTDTTASGTGAIDSVVSADEFVSTVAGSEDYHLKSGAQCIDTGEDLGTSPTGINLDIDGRDVDAEGDTWDIGADEFVGGGAPAQTRYSSTLLLMGVGL